MPLINKGSKKAFQQNVKTEMEANPDKDSRAQNLAIAYSIKKKNAKKKMASGGSVESDFKSERETDIDRARTPEELNMLLRHRMAQGGSVEESASDEKRPMPDQTSASSAEARRNSMRKKLEQADWTDDAAVQQVGRSKSIMPGEVEKANFHSGKLGGIDDANDEIEMKMERESSTDPMDIDSDHDEDIEDAKYADGGDVSNPKLAASREEMPNADSRSILDELMHRAAKKKYADGGQVDLDENAREHDNMEDDLSFEALKKENYSESDALDTDQPEDSNEHSPEHDEMDVEDRPLVDEARRRMKRRQS